MKTSYLRGKLLLLGCFVATGGFHVQAASIPVTGGMTTVDLDSGTVTALTNAGIAVSPVGTATLSGLTATFPITGGSIDWSTYNAVIRHDGSGLALKEGSSVLDLTDFLITANLNTQTGVLSGTVTEGAVNLTGVPLFNIGSGFALTLTSQAGGALHTYFGIPDFTGAPIGIAHVNPTLAPEPLSAGLAALAFALLFGVRFAQRRSAAQA